MTISKERLEQLRDKFLINLRMDFDDILSWSIEELGKNPKKFLKQYIKELKNDPMEDRGLKTNLGYYLSDFPLRLKDFTEEEIKYLEEVENE